MGSNRVIDPSLETDRFRLVAMANYIEEISVSEDHKKPKNKKQAVERARSTARKFGLIPYTHVEGFLFGPVYMEMIEEYKEDILNAFAGQKDIEWLHPEIELSGGRCTKIIVHMQHTFWRNRLKFEMPTMKPSDLVRIIWTAVEGAKELPNVAPAMLAREILSRHASEALQARQ